ncbi:MAG: bifunctional demethylmenaquinone methyltransferase/2-methoxy-6-polyprenyl-1,4-benzoquinol methylase UbiE [Ignavibacteria bacterium]|nr:bifunctional demethylmenaquinone methyltransferase/2-methoxy-6-polyprenyl-1,4-benzoquinol methylase UbiE [Ignavibacteria bacterium]
MSEEIHAMFTDIAPRYDVTNSVLSLGVHHIWRSITVKESGAIAGSSVLDCATGTGDLAISFAQKVGPTGRVVGTDFNAEMLSTAPDKAFKKGFSVAFELADVMKLPYSNAEFDISSIAFGIRNVDDKALAISELARVVKPGGKVVILEFGQPNGLLGASYRLFSRKVIPLVGGLLTGNRRAYEYLPETAASFPCREDFLDLMRSTGQFSLVKYRELTGGIAFLYIGTVA